MEKFWVLDESTELSADYKQYLTNNVRLHKVITVSMLGVFEWAVR